MKELASKDNIKLSLVILFSVMVLTFWNNFTSKKQQEKIEQQNQQINKVVNNVEQEKNNTSSAEKSNKNSTVEFNIEEISNQAGREFLNNKSKYKDPNSKFIKDYQKSINKNLSQDEVNEVVDGKFTDSFTNLSSFFEKNLHLQNYKMTQKVVLKGPHKIEKKDKDQCTFTFNVSAEEKNLLLVSTNLHIKNIDELSKGSEPASVTYTFSFQKKNFKDIVYINKDNEFIKIDASKIKKNTQFTLNGFFGISSNYFNFSFIKKEDSKIKISVTESDDEYFLNLILVDSNNIVLKDKKYQEYFHIFAGGKDINLLKKYAKEFNIPKFQAILDLGFFSIIAKPILIALEGVNKYLNNYILSIIVITLLLKIITIPLISSSYRATKKMKDISPRISQLKELYKDDKIKMNQEVMKLYKEYKINPFSAMVPMLIQIPILFAFYKVLSNAFCLYGAKGIFWIKDLSAPEGLSFVNIFGLLPINVPAFLNIGPMSLLMGFTTFLQQKLSSTGNMDESQKSLMYIMPIFLTFISASFPSGLLVYWIFSNIFSILHQYLYNKRIVNKK